VEVHQSDGITISVPGNFTIVVGETKPFPVALPYAPAAGTSLSVTSSDPTVATVTPLVFVPAGSNMPAPLPFITGIKPGYVTINVDGAGGGFFSGFQTVQVLPK
jgi:uncharacterized protein YjdB